MQCIYCKGPTSVTNSRKQRGGQAIWRRRLCKHCGALFTTTENVDLTTSIMVEDKNGELIPFSRDTLFFSIATSCGHRKSATADAAALTDTIIRKLLAQSQAVLPLTTLKRLAHGTLSNFDVAAATYYQAYFGD